MAARQVPDRANQNEDLVAAAVWDMTDAMLSKSHKTTNQGIALWRKILHTLIATSLQTVRWPCTADVSMLYHTRDGCSKSCHFFARTQGTENIKKRMPEYTVNKDIREA
jgi:hypothetical protein